MFTAFVLFPLHKEAFSVSLGLQETSVHRGQAWNPGFMPPVQPPYGKNERHLLCQFFSSKNRKQETGLELPTRSVLWVLIRNAGWRQVLRSRDKIRSLGQAFFWVKFSYLLFFFFFERTGLGPQAPDSPVLFVSKRYTLCFGAVSPHRILRREKSFAGSNKGLHSSFFLEITMFLQLWA